MKLNLNEHLQKQNFSFDYDGKKCTEYAYCESVKKSVNGEKEIYEITYAYVFGVNIVKELIFYKKFDTVSQVLHIENVSGGITGRISNLKDFDGEFIFKEPKKASLGWGLDESVPRVYSFEGSNISHAEFLPCYKFLYENVKQSYKCVGGRSSHGTMPYFNINQTDIGVIAAIGWTGQWNAEMVRQGKKVKLSSCVEDTDFCLYPGEKLKTTSTTLVYYDDGYSEGQNRLKRYIKYKLREGAHIKGVEDVPFSMMFWGSMPTDTMLERIDFIHKQKLGYTYIWIDAGWYGHSTQDCPNVFTGDWGCHTGSWVVNRKYHPDNLEEVSEKIKDSGLKLCLWFEPERVITGTDVTLEHPDWFFKLDFSTWILNLGNEEAWQGTFNMLSYFIEKLNISCYRQDFNFQPLRFWNENEPGNRKGINQIKHITGLYRLWDALLAKFPHLIIDTCASGGKRLDIEMCTRAIPLWRSDYTVAFDSDPATLQNHNTGISALFPYSGIGLGSKKLESDPYNYRSTFAAAGVHLFLTYADWPLFKEDFADILRKRNEEFLSVREYFAEDFYPLVDYYIHENYWAHEQHGASLMNADETNWAGWQYNRKERGDGIIVVFRRERSPMTAAEFRLKGLEKSAKYEITDIDTGIKKVMSGNALMKSGFKVEIKNKRESRLYRYIKV